MPAPWTFGPDPGPIPTSKLDDNFTFYSKVINLTVDGTGVISKPNYATQLQVQLNNFSWYSLISSALPGDLYGGAANVTRTVSGGATVGMFGSGQGATGVTSEVWGIVSQAIAQPGCTSTLVAGEHGCSNQSNNNTNFKVGLYVVFKDRGDGIPGTTQPLGANQFNYKSRALWVASQVRSTTGEFCGFKQGIYFDVDCLDADTTGPAIGIDFADVHYYGGNDPTTAYRMTAAIRFAPYQSVLWNAQPATTTDPANPVRSYFHANATPNARLVLATNTGAERLSVDVATGENYWNGRLPVGFRVNKNGSNQVVGTGANTKITFAVADFDLATDYNMGTQGVTIPANMVVTLSATVQIQGSGSACRMSAIIYKNGAPYETNSNSDGGTSKPFGVFVQTVVKGNGSDFYELYMFQDSGGNVTVSGLATDTTFKATTGH